MLLKKKGGNGMLKKETRKKGRKNLKKRHEVKRELKYKIKHHESNHHVVKVGWFNFNRWYLKGIWFY